MNAMVDRQVLEQLTRQLANDGKLIEAGWVSLRLHAMPPDASVDQVQAMRMAFMAGAQHLFASMLTFLDGDSEPTEGDMKRMDLIDTELREFATELKQRLGDHVAH